MIDAAAVPYVDGARQAMADGYVSGGTRRNLDWVRDQVSAGVSEDELLLLADAQTSGGLLVVGEVPGSPVIGEVVPAGATCAHRALTPPSAAPLGGAAASSRSRCGTTVYLGSLADS